MKTDSREEIRLRRNRGAEFGIRQTIFDFFRVGKQPYIMISSFAGLWRISTDGIRTWNKLQEKE